MATGITGFQQITSLGSAVSLTIPAGTRKAPLQAESQNVRLRMDGEDPTSGVGMLIVAGAQQPTEIVVGLADAKVIEASGGAKLNITYYGDSD